jgi:uncharacterized membrane protein YdjX (TVP38/TMEM64 family)
MKLVQQKNILIKAAIFFLLVKAIFLLSYYGARPFSLLGPLGEKLGEFYTKKDGVPDFLIARGAYSPIVFILIQALQVLISPIPGELTGVAGGYIYGDILGFIYSTIGLTFGSWAAFALARFFGRPFVQKVVGENVVKKFDFLTTDSGATVCFLLFMIPGFPKDALCYLLGLSRMRLAMFFVLSTLGRMPGTYLLTLEGTSVRSEQYQTAVAIVVLSAVILFVAYLCRKHLDRWIRNLSIKAVRQKF